MLFRNRLFLFGVLLALACAQALAQGAATAPAPPSATPDTPFSFSFGFGDNYLGIHTEDVTRENMAQYGLREPRGVIVMEVVAGSPAERADLKKGDVLLRFDGENVTTTRKLSRLVNEAPAGDTVRIAIRRGGNEQEITLTLGQRTQGAGGLGGSLPRIYELPRARSGVNIDPQIYALGTGRRIGVSTTELTKQLADYFGVAGGQGVLISAVREESPAAKAGLKAGDVITEVDGTRVADAGALTRAINRKSEGEITLTVVRDRKSLSIKVTPERGPNAFEITPRTGRIQIPAIEFPRIELPSIEIRDLKLPEIRIETGPAIERLLRRIAERRVIQRVI